MWSSIKDILKDGKTKCIIIENEKPLYVVLPFEVYQQLQKSENSVIVEENSQNADSPRLRESEAGADEINGEIQEVTDEGPAESPEGIQAGPPQSAGLGGEDELAPPTVRLEDLPF